MAGMTVARLGVPREKKYIASLKIWGGKDNEERGN